MIGREDEIREYRLKTRKLSVLVLLFLGILGIRLFFLQVIKGDELRRFSEANRLKKEKLHPTRGIIFDRNGKVIVDNRAAFDVVLLAQYYPFKEEMNARLASVLGLEVPDLERKLQKIKRGPIYYPMLLRADVSKDMIASVEMDTEGFPGVDIEANVQRRFPHGDLSAQLLGYISEVDSRDITSDPKKKLERGDYIGRMGIERVFDQELRGENGVGYVEVDARGRRRQAEGSESLLGFVSQVQPEAGNNLYLTLDLDLEFAAAEAMKKREFSGSVVALDPRNGEVLALVNYPSFRPEELSGREVPVDIWNHLSTNEERPLRNRSVQDIYPPGSTFKSFMAIAALAEGVATPSTSFNCNGGMQFGNRRFSCWKKHGSVDFIKAIKESCDVYFYNLGIQLGIDNIAKYAKLFGLGQKTGIGLTHEQEGVIPSTEWKELIYKDKWHPGETLSVAIGQGYVSVTPLQLAVAFGAIGNEGFIYRPRIVRRIEGRTGKLYQEFPPAFLKKIEVPSEVFKTVKEGLRQVVNVPGGTAFSARSQRTVISGKTGTAQVRGFSNIMSQKCENLDRNHRHHGWFVGYAPQENPEIVVSTIVEHGCHSSAAALVVRDVIEGYFKKQDFMHGKPLVEESPKTSVVREKAALSNENEE